MGYQIGNICYADRTSAENAYYSQVIPTLQNGQLHQVQWTPVGWQYKGQTINAPLPECSIEQNFKDGSAIGWAIFSIYAAIWGILLIKQRLRT